MTRGHSTRSWRRVDLLGIVLAAASTAVFVAHGLLGNLDRDLAIYTYAGQRVADGEPPYVGIVNRSGPLSHLVPGLGIWLGRLVGADDVRAVRVLFLAISVAAVYAAYRLGRTLLGSPVAGLAVGASLVVVQGFVDYASRGPREKTLMVLLLLVALHALATRRWLATGVAISLATLTWQPVFFAAIAAAVVGLALERRGHRLQALLRLGVGGVVPLLLFLGWYAVIGHLRAFLDCFVLIHVRYTSQQGMLADLGHYVRDLVTHYGPSLWVLLLGLVAAAVGGAVGALRLARRHEDRDAGSRDADAFAVALAAGTVVAVLWTVRAYNGWPDAFLLLPFAVAGIATVVRALRVVAPRRVVLGVAVAWTVVAVVLASVYAVDTRSDGLEAQRSRAQGIMDVLGPDATMLSIQAPAPLVLTGQVNPIRHQQFSLGLEDYVDDVWPGGLARLTDDLLERRPTVVVVGVRFRPAWVQELLDRGYRHLGYDQQGRYGWFVSDEVPWETRARAKHVIHGDTTT